MGNARRIKKKIMPKILITGHLGFIGSYLTKELDDFIGLDIKEDNDILTCHLPDADIVIHLAAEPGVLKSMDSPYKNAETNIMGTIRLAERYKKSKFIFTSSGGAIQEVIESPYGLSKYTCEQYIKILCNDYVILRVCNVFGKGSRSVIDKFLNNDIDIYGDGSATRTYGYVDDVVRAIKASMTWPKGLYKLGSDQNYNVAEIAEAIGKPVRFSPHRKGELLHSNLENTTPGWETTLDAMDYIQQCLNTTYQS
jgi:UDP-glucose 4-epimerase